MCKKYLSHYLWHLYFTVISRLSEGPISAILRVKDTEDTHTHKQKLLPAKPICFVMATLVISSWRVSDDVIIKERLGWEPSLSCKATENYISESNDPDTKDKPSVWGTLVLYKHRHTAPGKKLLGWKMWLDEQYLRMILRGCMKLWIIYTGVGWNCKQLHDLVFP